VAEDNYAAHVRRDAWETTATAFRGNTVLENEVAALDCDAEAVTRERDYFVLYALRSLE